MGNSNFYNRGQSLVGIIFVLVIAGLISGGLYFYLSKQIPEVSEITKKPAEEEIVKPEEEVAPPPEELSREEVAPEEKIEKKPAEKLVIQKCTDGTPYGQCSVNKPKYCDEGNLINKCSTCGCPSGQECQIDGSCILPFYAIRPVIFLAADTNIDVNSYQSQVNNSFSVVRDWYAGQLGGKTFNLQPALVHRSSLTESQLYAKYGAGTDIWFEGLKKAVSVNGLNVCNEHRFYYFVTPINDINGGMVGAENLGCSYVLPGTASIPAHMGRLIGGIIDPDWSEWWADEIREAQGGVAHEIAHGLGGSCTVGNFFPDGGCNGLPHNEDWDADSIILEWWLFGIGGRFTNEEKTQILQSPFIS